MLANPAWQGYRSETNERQGYHSSFGMNRNCKAAIAAYNGTDIVPAPGTDMVCATACKVAFLLHAEMMRSRGLRTPGRQAF